MQQKPYSSLYTDPSQSILFSRKEKRNAERRKVFPQITLSSLLLNILNSISKWQKKKKKPNDLEMHTLLLKENNSVLYYPYGNIEHECTEWFLK